MAGQIDVNYVHSELLECARYGEADDLRALILDARARTDELLNIDHSDTMGSTALHKAAANGHTDCLNILKEFGARHIRNNSGNYPIHWAAENGKIDAVKFLIENYDVDVLEKNDFGMSVLSCAFKSGNADAIALCLSHSSAAEDRIIEKPTAECTGTAGADFMELSDSSSYDEANAVFHDIKLLPEEEAPIMRVRELPITRADSPFGTDVRPEDDTTGLGIWPASLLMSRMVVHHRELLRDKVVVELGAGCGLPSIAAALYSSPSKVYLTDIHEPTIRNAQYNIALNSLGTLSATSAGSSSDSPLVEVKRTNWQDSSSFPAEKADVLIGSDLVYDERILSVLIPAVTGMLKEDGTFLYLAPEDARDGMDLLVSSLASVGIICVQKTICPDSMFDNPLVNDNGDLYVLHFYDLSAMKPHAMYVFQRDTP